ncbi:DNA replication and repair protein RecF [Patescibacteria group bacterium]|nr:DNA replication and repair protein RecF [Patescibacteria group bacterium]MBU1970297.1 DNA replication and repair protein RecF [Patescibacteria group bacterium]
MTIKNLKLTGFRNHQNFETQFSSSVTLITGPNGSGKTNLLEAVDLLATGKSFRARYDHELIFDPQINGPGEEPNKVFDGSVTDRQFAKVAGTVSNGPDEELLELIIIRTNPNSNVSQKTFKLNGTNKKPSEAANFLQTVLFTPQDLELFTGPPTLRRRFLDDLLCKTDQKYQKEHTIYTKSLRQRNKVLEKIHKTALGQDELSFWTTKILQSGTYIQECRTALIAQLNELVGQTYADISAKPADCLINYQQNSITAERLKQYTERELAARCTLIGPHRDDFSFLLNKYDISHYGSRGQQRTAVVSLKIAELEVAGRKPSPNPVLLLDDIFSELDNEHKKSLRAVVQRQQTIITSTDSADYLHLAGNMQILL